MIYPTALLLICCISSNIVASVGYKLMRESLASIVHSRILEQCWRPFWYLNSFWSLLMHNGGSREGLLQFFNLSKCSLRRLDLRLPYDVDNTHLLVFAQNPNFNGLVSLRLQSCILESGEGLKAVCRAVGNVLEELHLIYCDVLEREPGLVAALKQDLKRLRKLDLSFNDMVDMELISMLVYCDGLDELRLKGCCRLSDAAMVSMIRSCRKLQIVDVSNCCGIGEEGVEFVVMNALLLRQFAVEKSKLTPLARSLAYNKSLLLVS